jgi:hypothetical protein
LLVDVKHRIQEYDDYGFVSTKRFPPRVCDGESMLQITVGE